MNYQEVPEIQNFCKYLQKLEIQLTEIQLQQFMDYYEMLVEKNKVMNLTAITELQEVINKHFIDSLALVKVMKLNNQKLLDLGTGAGFPGIPLKIAYPNLNIVLLDSLKKRLNFLDEVIDKLNLNDIKTIHGRAEDYGRDIKYRESFDVCVSRAVARLSSLAEYCLPYVKKNGYFISYKSGNIEQELQASSKAIKILGAEVEQVHEFLLPENDVERTLIVIKKTGSTPKNYPRAAGKPSKEPL